jgi:hypothetical protein
MLQSVAGMTRMQATLFQEATYSNKWIRINGPLSEVMGSSSYATLVFHIDGVVTRVDMKGEFVSKVSHLVRGDVVTVDAVFKSMDDIGPDFEEGELVATP